MNELLGLVAGLALIVVMVLAVAVLVALPMMLVVNYLFSTEALVAVFGTPKIGFWKAFWLSFFFGLVTSNAIGLQSKHAEYRQYGTPSPSSCTYL